MMTEKQRIEWLLELQELTNEREQSDACINSAERGGRRRSQHPEQLTDEQMKEILADDEMRLLVQQLGFAKRAFKYDELKNDTPDVDAEWEKFAARHAEELTNAARAEGNLACTMPCKEEEYESQLDALDEGEYKPRLRAYLAPRKIAASFIGVLLASGIAFAAIQVVRNISTPKTQLPSTEQVTDTKPVTSLPIETVKADTITTEPYVFNNVPLDSMLTTIAAAYGVGVEFENESARQLRFHFVWKREDSLSRVVEKLNTFEAVNIGMEDKTLVVK